MKTKNKFYDKFYFLYVILVFMSVVNTVICAFFEPRVFFASLVITLVSASLVVYRFLSIKKTSEKLSMAFLKESKRGSDLLSSFSLPVVYTDASGEILWHNDVFSKYFPEGNYLGKNIYDDLMLRESSQHSEQFELLRDGFEFTAYRANSQSGYRIFYLIDNTEFKRSVRELAASKPVVMMITYDNFSEVLRNAKDSERNSFKSAIHKEIEAWLSNTPCITVNRTESMLTVLEERYVNTLIENKFSILDSVRKIKIDEFSGVTLSIGVGRGGKNLSESETFCRQALDMAQSRGGDQVAIKSPGNDYRFFGGRAKAVERRTTVRARVISSAICEMMSAASKIVIMGHKFSDLDSLGSAYGIGALASYMGKQPYIVFDSEKTLALPLYKLIASKIPQCVFTKGDNIGGIIDDKTLLIVVDTHRAGYVENSEVYKSIKNVIVIDHHRKAVDAIDNAVIFYHETATSSTCEMVSELLQYVDGFTPDKIAAEAMLGGIMLDTKNFCLHTGVRTFEASAYLRSCGADPVEVKKLFADSMLTYSRRAQIVGACRLYGDCAISFDGTSDEVTRIACSQAADEMLNLENVNASFVMYKSGEEINISARSLGSVNVQLIMEALGGGGHQNMAACQIKNNDFQQVSQMLINAINSYHQQQS